MRQHSGYSRRSKMKQDYNTQYQEWKDAVDTIEAMMVAKGHSAAKARKWALAKARLLHPAAQAAVRRNLSLNRDYINGAK